MIRVRDIGQSAPEQEKKHSKKFNKYLIRMNQFMEGTCKKLPNTPVLIHTLSFNIYTG